MKNFLAYFGHLNIDTVLKVRKFAERGTERILKKKVEYGGTAGNFAMASNRLGFPFRIYSAVGALTHGDYLRKFTQLGIDTNGISIFENGYGPECYIIDSGGEQIAYMNQGPMDDWSDSSVINEITDFQYVHVSTGPPEFYFRILKASKNSTKIFDPGQEVFYNYSSDMVVKMSSIADMLIFNENEYSHISDLISSMKDDKTIIVTRGEKGADIIRKGNITTVPGFKMDNISGTVGAGDVFRSGFYMGLFRKKTLKESVLIGNAAAALWVSSNDFEKLNADSLLSMALLKE